MAARKKVSDQNKYQIWAADVDKSWGNLIFEINIIIPALIDFKILKTKELSILVTISYYNFKGCLAYGLSCRR